MATVLGFGAIAFTIFGVLCFFYLGWQGSRRKGLLADVSMVCCVAAIIVFALFGPALFVKLISLLFPGVLA